MNNFYKVLTAEEYFNLTKDNPAIAMPLEEIQAIANVPDGICLVCGQENIWKLGQSGMCFTCTTGEADASEDYELKGEQK